MKIIKWDKDGGGQMVRVDEREALALIASLARQISQKSPNADREEFITEDGKYFSIAVHPKRNEERGLYIQTLKQLKDCISNSDPEFAMAIIDGILTHRLNT